MDFGVASLGRLVESLARLPGVGPKSFCRQCGHITDRELCVYCRSETRDRSLLCVVEQPLDVFAVERTGEYRGLYHVLHGALSPMNGVGPDRIHARELLERLGPRADGSEEVREVILALDPDLEGEATALYLVEQLRESAVVVTRLAHGLPMGADLEYADEGTVARALLGRRPAG
jgi:recombination protein RecR